MKWVTQTSTQTQVLALILEPQVSLVVLVDRPLGWWNSFDHFLGSSRSSGFLHGGG